MYMMCTHYLHATRPLSHSSMRVHALRKKSPRCRHVMRSWTLAAVVAIAGAATVTRFSDEVRARCLCPRMICKRYPSCL